MGAPSSDHGRHESPRKGEDIRARAADTGGMTLAYDYPLLGLLWTTLWFFLLVIWIMTLFHVLGDVFRSRDMGGFAKAIWLLFVIVFPFLGVFVYLVARGDNMARHAAEDRHAAEQAATQYIRQAAGTAGPADQIAQLVALHDAGKISDAELAAGKAKILG